MVHTNFVKNQFEREIIRLKKVRLFFSSISYPKWHFDKYAKKLRTCQNSIKKSVGGSFQNPLHVDCIGEALRLAKERMNSKNVYYLNPSFDTPSK